MIKTEDLPATPLGIARAVAILRAGGLVAMPTETVYGLAGDARSNAAVAAIFAAKGRPAAKALIVLLSDLAAAGDLAVFDSRAEALAAAFWPGPLTLVLPRHGAAGLAPQVSGGLHSIALRVPAHPVAQALLAAFGGPLAVPSANPSGGLDPTHPGAVRATLGGRIAAILDAGPCPLGVPSSIVSLDGPATLLRLGAVPRAALERVLGLPLLVPPNPDSRALMQDDR